MTARSSAAASLLANLDSTERADVAVVAIAQSDSPGLARVGAAWFAQLDVIAKVDPLEAGRLAAAMYGHLAAHRPESPAPLDSGFVPTETVPRSAL